MVSKLRNQASLLADMFVVNHLSESAQDYRDITAFPDCEAPGQLRFEEHLNAGPRPNVGCLNNWDDLQFG